MAQFITLLPEMANRVAHSWQAYNAKIEEPSEEVIKMLTNSSAEWVRLKLAHPEHVNNRLRP